MLLKVVLFFPSLFVMLFRLYDGSLTMHSAPILMQCSTKVAPEVLLSKLTIKKGDGLDNFNCFVTAALCKLDYQVSSRSALKELENWKDIVKSVDIFISKPIYTYDQNGKCTGIENIDSSNANKVHCLLTMDLLVVLNTQISIMTVQKRRAKQNTILV